MIDKIKAACARSLTIAWSYLLAFVGGVFQVIDSIADALGDPNLKQQIQDVIGNDPKTLGRILLGISVITIIARARSLMKKPG